MISFGLDEDLQLIKDTVAEFAAEQLRPHLREFEKTGRVSDEVRGAFHEIGMTSLAVPEAADGQGLGLRAHVVVTEELAVGDVGAAADLDRSAPAIHMVVTLGSDEQQAQLLKPFGDPSRADYTGTIAWHEPIAGTDLGETETVASGDGERVTLTGQKMAVAAAADADFLVVTARVAGTEGERGIRAYVVQNGAAGLSVADADYKVGLGTLTTHAVTFVQTPAQLLAKATDADLVRMALRKVQVLGAARMVGLARAACEYALQYSKERETFGQPIGQHQAIAFKLADMGILVDAARWSVWRAAAGLEDGGDGAVDVPCAVMQAAEAGRFCAFEAVQILGGHGYIKDHPVEKWMRDSRAQEILYGISELESVKLADALLV